jgi:glycosyltransferase involved in cell wall biosynthesis
MPTVVHVTTVAESLRFIDGLVGRSLEQGYSVHVVSSPSDMLTRFARKWEIAAHAMDMPRKISVMDDLDAVSRLASLFSHLRPDIVHAHTPKGGLLGMLAARIAGVPVRIYQMRGLPLVTAQGAMRALLTLTEQVSCRQATRVICQSHSLRAVALEAQLCGPEHIEVVLQGSNGVDSVGRYNPGPLSQRRSALRDGFGLPSDSLVFGFVGRLVRDKGIVELWEAWRELREELPKAYLLLAGPFEERDPVPASIAEGLRADPRVRLLGETEDTPAVYAASDVIVLPTFREGFPNVPLEAAAMGLPVVATRIPGCIDAVVDEQTGLLVAPGSGPHLKQALKRYAEDPPLRRQHGTAGRERVLRDFQRERIWEAQLALYLRELNGSRPERG